MATVQESMRRRDVRRDAERGHVAAQTVLGQLLLDGGADGPADPPDAVRWFRIAAAAGFVPARNMLGRCLERGWGTPPDLLAAAACYEAAAGADDDWACYNLANMLLRGRGVPRDRARAWALFRRAAGNGHAKSMNLVARFLEEGWDRPRDPAAAALWYRRSAEHGDYRGRHNLATLLAERGRLAEALGWWNLALPEATADILAAMETTLSRCDGDAAHALLLRVRQRQRRSGSDCAASAPVADGRRRGLVRRVVRAGSAP